MIQDSVDGRYDLTRFIRAQERDFETALSEIKNGRKLTHWMWYVFPQVRGLGRSSTSEYYGIEDLGEARAYLRDETLSSNLRRICEELLRLDTNDAHEVFGSPDDMKLRSSMTLFLLASEGDPLFEGVLEKFFGGKKDPSTLRILGADR